MALTDKEYEKFYKETGSGSDKIAAANKAYAKTAFEYSATHGFSDIIDDYRLGPIIYMMQQMQDELDYLRTEISNNKNKTTFPGLGTSNSTAMAGDTTTISSSQASAITANTAKTGITSQEQKDIANTKSEVANNVSEISKNKTAISTNTNAVVASIRVGSYPPSNNLLAGTTQSHGSEIVYDARQKKYFLNIYYIEDTPATGGKKGQRIIRAGQIELR